MNRPLRQWFLEVSADAGRTWTRWIDGDSGDSWDTYAEGLRDLQFTRSAPLDDRPTPQFRLVEVTMAYRVCVD